MPSEVSMTSVPLDAPLGASASGNRTDWRALWWKLLDIRIGIIPIPVFVVLLAVFAGSVATGSLTHEINMMIAVLAVCGFTCGELGKRLPVFRHIGAAAIFATFIPSALAYYHVLPAQMLKSVVEFTKFTNFLYLFIACIIVGSVLSMNRDALVKGFFKIFVPLASGAIAAGCVGTLVGTLLGLDAKHTFFYIVAPIMSGGVGEGAIPLSMGYAEILNGNQGEIFAQVLPMVMLGSLMAILMSGLLNFIGKRMPHLTGNGQLQPGNAGQFAETKKHSGPIDANTVAAAGLFAVTLYLMGVMAQKLVGLPAPVAMLFIAVLIKVLQLASPSLEAGAGVVYKFFQVAVTYPLLFAMGVAVTPWDKLVSAFNVQNLIIIFCTVATHMTVGFFVGRMVKMYPIETAIINSCNCGQGGTGDVAILTAANRMQLMPFAQVATRIGGAITVTLSLIAMAKLI
ncbi:malate permease [Azospirillum sp. TSH100]|uniref:2-hydroxycarboxylate transporter family protein n=1 Tax=Azospirillum sp. TSH100 TaxID=652764 RepID=UPI000D61AD6E|nr:2-hydroxycarboxylate transporter family protein [Azospirillum sp. TSH100]PWC84725.1 malate permease [Azospirillum sp. TSH100]QCG90132.1 2-hydroxycarboxylate transporter family protein [Azospirillum sp. TSH100]